MISHHPHSPRDCMKADPNTAIPQPSFENKNNTLPQERIQRHPQPAKSAWRQQYRRRERTTAPIPSPPPPPVGPPSTVRPHSSTTQGREGGEPLPSLPPPAAIGTTSLSFSVSSSVQYEPRRQREKAMTTMGAVARKEREEEETLLKDLPFLPPSVRPSDYLDLSLVWVGGIREKYVNGEVSST